MILIKKLYSSFLKGHVAIYLDKNYKIEKTKGYKQMVFKEKIYKGGATVFTEYDCYDRNSGDMKKKRNKIRFLINLIRKEKTFLRSYINKNGPRIISLMKISTGHFIVTLVQRDDFRKLLPLMKEHGIFYSSKEEAYLLSLEKKSKINLTNLDLSKNGIFTITAFPKLVNRKLILIIQETTTKRNFYIQREYIIRYDFKDHSYKKILMLKTKTERVVPRYCTLVKALKEGSLIITINFLPNFEQIKLKQKKG